MGIKPGLSHGELTTRKPSLTINIIANFVGRAWAIAVIYLFTPFYVDLLGIEGFGIVSLYNTFIGILLLLDIGITATVGREVAKSNFSSEKSAIRTLVLSLETLLFLIVLTAAFVAYFTADYVVPHLLKSSYDYSTQKSLYIGMILAGTFYLLSSFYFGCLHGAERQVLANILQFVWSFLRSAGAVVILIYYEATPEVFVFVQIASNVAYTLVQRFFVYKLFHAQYFNGAFHWPAVKTVMPYAISVSAITLISTVNMQADKLLINTFLGLDGFGKYSLAWSLGQIPIVLSTPISIAVFPRLNALVAAGDRSNLSTLFTAANYGMNLLIIPASIFICFFSQPILSFWIGGPALTDDVVLATSILIIGSMSLCFQVLTFNLALANGVTKYNLILGLTSIVISVPLLYLTINRFGLVGAAYSFLLQNILLTPTYLYIVHRKLMSGYFVAFFLRNVLPIAICSCVIFIALKLFISSGNLWVMAFVFGVGFLTIMGMLMAIESIFFRQDSYFKKLFLLVKTI